MFLQLHHKIQRTSSTVNVPSSSTTTTKMMILRVMILLSMITFLPSSHAWVPLKTSSSSSSSSYHHHHIITTTTTTTAASRRPPICNKIHEIDNSNNLATISYQQSVTSISNKRFVSSTSLFMANDSSSTRSNYYEQWYATFERLKAYKEEYGHANVPDSYNDGGKPHLGKWVSNKDRTIRKDP